MNSPFALALAWALVHFVWEGAAIAGVAGGILLATRRSAARFRYAVSCLALAAMALAFCATFAVYLSRSANANRAAVVFIPSGSTLARGAGAIAQHLPAGPPYARWFVPLWLLGVAACYGRAIAACVGTRRLRRIGVCPPRLEWRETVQRLAAQLGVTRAVALLESCLTDVPVVAGWLRPVILLPVGMIAGLPAAQVEAILVHELAHIRRWDYFVNLIQTCVEGLLFYHPAVWWISSVIRAERENCCDDAVVAWSGDTRGYVAALANLEQKRAARELALAATGGSLMKRIRRLLKQPEGPRNLIAPALSAGLLVLIFCLGMALYALPQRTPPLTSYQRWVTEDVAYIISDPERIAFDALRTDEEREKFIEQFWLRRDPTPGTPENEMKEEHYRRIAYANEHFSQNGVPGWRTERGRAYIADGPLQGVNISILPASASTRILTVSVNIHSASGIEGQWIGSDGRIIQSFVDDVTGAGIYQKSVPLSPGSYVLKLSAKDRDGVSRETELPVEVK